MSENTLFLQGPALPARLPNFLESLLFLLGDPEPEGKVPAGNLPEFLYQVAEPNPGERPFSFLPGKVDKEGKFLGPGLPGFAREGLQQFAHLLNAAGRPAAYVDPSGSPTEAFPAAGLLPLLPFGASAPKGSLGAIGGRMGLSRTLSDALKDAQKLSEKFPGRQMFIWHDTEKGRYITTLGSRPAGRPPLVARTFGEEVLFEEPSALR